MPETPQVVVSNTTPIITLALVGQLPLLQYLYGTVLIPPAVEAEIIAGGSRYGALELSRANYIRTVPLVDPARAALLNDLDPGEAEAIALALEQNANLLIMDERLGRRHASRLGLTLTGSVGILLMAKQTGRIKAIKPLLTQLDEGGIHLSPALISQVLKEAGEND
jgi:predicted nucleic acid-binding protein